MLTLLRRSQKTKTINGSDSAGDDHRPARRCRRWREPLLKLTSLITSQLSGAVWRSPAFPMVRFKKKPKTHSTKINRSRGENGISDFCLLTGAVLWWWERFWSRLECRFVLLSFLFRVRRGARGNACSREVRGSQVRIGRHSSQHTHTI